jgi:16S rRNA (guanine527-N7)-methyltransferase
MESTRLLQQGLETMGIQVFPVQQTSLLDYLALMRKWNHAYNLTAINDPEQMVIRHLLDSLSILPFIGASPVLDVGSGAGLPGIPLAIALPQFNFVLLDNNGKKTRFMTQAKIELGLQNIEVVHSRIEDFQPKTPLAIVTCRAFAALNTILDSTRHLVTSNTRVLAMKAKAEMHELPVGYAQVASHDLYVAFLDEPRILIEIKKS